MLGNYVHKKEVTISSCIVTFVTGVAVIVTGAAAVYITIMSQVKYISVNIYPESQVLISYFQNEMHHNMF